MSKSNCLYVIDDYVIDTFQLEIRHIHNDELLTMQQKPMEVLEYLLDHHPELVTREELIEHIWDGNIYVGEKALTNAIWQLRSTFERLGLKSFIQTVRKRGYRLEVTPIRQEREHSSSSEDEGKNESADALHLIQESQHEQKKKRSAAFRPLSWKRVLLVTLLVVVIFIYELLFHQHDDDLVETTLAVEVPTLSSGRAQHVDVSPDGKWLVYVWRSFNGNTNLFLQPVEHPEQREQLTFSADKEAHPVWDYEGQHVLFVRQNIVTGACQVFRVSRHNKKEEYLHECRPSASNYITAHPMKHEYYFSGPTQNKSNLYRMVLDETQDGTHISSEVIPCQEFCRSAIRDMAVSPNGQYLALSRRAHRFSEDLYLLDLQTMQETRLTEQEIDIIGFSWHPDGRHLILISLEQNKRRAFLFDTQSRTKTPLGLDNVSNPSRILTDGTWYYHAVTSRVQLAYLNVDTSIPSALFPMTWSDEHHRNPHLNQHTGQYVFVSGRSGSDELWLANSDFRDLIQLTHLDSIVRYPRWSHNGRYIAFVARFPNEQKDVLSLYEVATGRIERLYEFERVLGRPTWWHDDSKLVVREAGNLFTFSVTHPGLPLASRMEQLTFHGGIYAQSWADNTVFFTKGANQGLWLLNHGNDEELLISGDVFTTRYSWVVTSDGVYFYSQTQDTDHLVFFDFETQQLEQILSIPPELVSNQSTFTYDDENKHLVIESWQANSKVFQARVPVE